MPQEKDGLTKQIEKVLRLERSHGYADDAVTCGLEEFIRRNLPDALPLVTGYGSATYSARQRTISCLLERLANETDEPTSISKAESLLSPVSRAKGVGGKRAALFEKLGIYTIEDLLTYLPRRLEDRSQFRRIREIKQGEETCVRAKVLALDQIRISPRMSIIKAALGDDTGLLYAVWFNQPWLAKQLPRGEEIDLFGKVEQHYGELQMRSPVWEPAAEGMETGRLVSIYPATEGVTDRVLRGVIARNLEVYGEAFQDLLPPPLRKRHNLLPKREAIRSVHFPKDHETFAKARRSLAFEELYLLQLGMAATVRTDEGRSHADSSMLADSFLASLPFQLTASQRMTLMEIVSDLRSPSRMLRLLQGDVGSGKTAVALAASLYAIGAGYQVAFMVPTEILAEQHVLRFRRLLAELPVSVALLTSGTREKEALKAQLSGGEIDLLVGTHALIQEDVSFHALGLVVIDEQHRFGVVQRSLIEEKGEQVDLLVMSATPIPRTIALTLYGEFDVSVIEESPAGRKETRTVWVAESRRAQVYAEASRLLEAGGKGYVVLPLVDESEKLDLKAAVQVADELSITFHDFGVGLIHGRLPTSNRSRIMEAFRAGELRLLVTTTVIEVGIDVLDADFMVIEHAERFGLSQLHQLRGRIGRAGQPATCFAIGEARTDEARRRLTVFASNHDGFSIAEEDLLIRGPGDLLGIQQHGFFSRLRAVDLLHDLDIIGKARQEARNTYQKGPSPLLTAEVERRFGDVLKWLRV